MIIVLFVTRIRKEKYAKAKETYNVYYVSKRDTMTQNQIRIDQYSYFL